jgi:predicted acylesterase/phospholipase RssA
MMATVDRASAQRRNIAITFAGGGNRAFFQLGLMHRWAERLLPRTAAVAACSAGACVATLVLSGRETQTRAFWRARRAHLRRNFNLLEVLAGRSPIPHAPIYRDTLLCICAEGGLERIREAPFPVLVLTAVLPRALPASVSVLLGFGAYNVEKRLRKEMIHPSLGRRIGFRPYLVDARSCETPEELADLVLASSSSPPFTPVGTFRGKRLLDGGMIDNVPASAAEGVEAVRRNLVLLTRPYPRNVLGGHGERLYVAPSEPVPIERWDYTRPDLLDATIDMGEREAELHEPALRRFLAC